MMGFGLSRHRKRNLLYPFSVSMCRNIEYILLMVFPLFFSQKRRNICCFGIPLERG